MPGGRSTRSGASMASVRRPTTSGKPIRRAGGVRAEVVEGIGTRERRLKRMYADFSLENAALKDVSAKKLYGLLSGGRSWRTWSRRAASRFSGPVARWDWAERRTTGPWRIGRGGMASDCRLHDLVVAKSRWGFWKCCDRLRLLGIPGITNGSVACIASCG